MRWKISWGCKKLLTIQRKLRSHESNQLLRTSSKTSEDRDSVISRAKRNINVRLKFTGEIIDRWICGSYVLAVTWTHKQAARTFVIVRYIREKWQVWKNMKWRVGRNWTMKSTESKERSNSSRRRRKDLT